MADIAIKVKSDFQQAEQDFKNLGASSESARAQIEKFQKSFKTEQIDKFMARNQMNAAAIRATQGATAAMTAESAGLQREIQRLIRSGLSPEDEALKKLRDRYTELNSQMGKAQRETQGFGNITKGILGAGIITQGFNVLTSGLKSFITEASKTEDTLVSFTTMLGGSEERAKALVSQMQILGAQTPFEFDDLAKATQMMIGFGVATDENVIQKLKMLGDVAQGNKERLSGITLAFSQIQAAGKASMQDVNQLVNNGVPILKVLAEQWGLTGDNAVGAARKMVEQGRATGTEVEKAFIKMTSQGGMFYNSMINASKTYTGVMSTLSDNLKMTASGIGSALLPKVKEVALYISNAASKVLEWVNNNKEFLGQAVDKVFGFMASALKTMLDILPWLIGAVIAYTVVTKAAAVGTGILAIATKVLNAVMLLNPFGLIAAAIGGILIPAIAWLVTNWENLAEVVSEKFDDIRTTFLMTIEYIKLGGMQAAKWVLAALIQMNQPFLEMIDNIITAYNAITGESLPKVSKSINEFMTDLDASIDESSKAADQYMKNYEDIIKKQAQVAKESQKTNDETAKNTQTNNDKMNESNKKAGKHAQDRVQLYMKALQTMQMSETAAQNQLQEAAVKFFEERAKLEGEDSESRIEFLQSQFDTIKGMNNLNDQQKLAAEKALNEAIEKEQKLALERRIAGAQMSLSATGEFLESVQQIMKNAGKDSYALAVMLKGVAMAEAAINSYLAFTKALTTLPYPFNLVAAGITLAAGLAKQVAIATTPIPSAETGITNYTVPEMRSTRNDRAAIMAQGGEQVTVTPRGEQQSQTQQISIQIGEEEIFRVVRKGIATGKIDVNNRNIGRAVFVT